MSRISPPILAVSVAAVLLTLGCDPADSDRDARHKLNQAYALRAANSGEREHVTLADEVAATTSSDATLALANELVGDVSVEMAGATVSGHGREPALGLGALQTRAIVLAEHANRLASALALGRGYIETEQKKDPQLVLDEVAKVLGQMQAGQAWAPAGLDDAQLPTLEEAQKRIDALNARLEQLNGQVAQLEEQHAQMLAQASDIDQQSDREQGQQSVDTYRKAADLRSEAAEISAGVQKLEAQARQATAELQEATALRDALQAGIAMLQQQEQNIRQRWGDVQTQIGVLQQAGQETYSGQTGTQASVELIGQELAATLTELSKLNDEATGLLVKASAAYGTAADKAGGANNARDPLFAEAYGEAFNAGRINLSRASALRQLGAVHTATASVYAGLHRLQQTLKEANQQLPDAIQEAMQTPPAEAYAESITAAAAALIEADEILSRLSSGGSVRGPVAQSALTLRGVSLSTILGLHGLIETTGIAVTLEGLPTPQQIREQATELAAAAQASNAPLPAAPPFTGPQGAAPATQPTTEPATQPATEPTTQPSTEPAGGETTEPAEEGGEGAEEPAPDNGSQPHS